MFLLGTKVNWVVALLESILWIYKGFHLAKYPLVDYPTGEEAEVKRQINVLVDLGKMKPNNFKYACCITLLVKKDGSRHFCGDYRPLNT
jgi:hypothetical protein